MITPVTFAQVAHAIDGCDIVDLSPLIEAGMPRWPTHPDVGVERDARTIEQHGYFAQTLVLPEHSGCHVDAPAHLGFGATVDELAVDTLVGPAKKIDASREELGPGDVLSYRRYRQIADQAGLTVSAGDIVLFEFGWDQHYADEVAGTLERGWWGANEPGLDENVCRSLHEVGVRAVGSDTAGCDIAERGGEIVSSFGHSTWFLPRGIPIVEGLQGLARVPAEFMFVALPLRIAGGSGSPLRAVGVVVRPSREL